jgi:hypothetical protein
MPEPKEDEEYDRAVEDSFPASDPPALGGITGPRATPVPASSSDEDTPPNQAPSSERTPGPKNRQPPAD